MQRQGTKKTTKIWKKYYMGFSLILLCFILTTRAAVRCPCCFMAPRSFAYAKLTHSTQRCEFRRRLPATVMRSFGSLRQN